MTHKAYFFVILCLFAVVLCNLHGSDIPQLISYQGVLLDGEGDPIAEDQSIEFLLYNAEEDGVALWSETQEVNITDGLFDVLLGSVALIPDQVFNSSAVYLALKVDSDEEMVPRKRLVSVGYAFHASNSDRLNGHDAESFIQYGDTCTVTAGTIMTGSPTTSADPDDIVSTNDVHADDFVEAKGEGTTTEGYLGGSSRGAYGKHTSTGNFGYMGSSTRGVYGEYASNGRYGYLGSSQYGVYGQASSYIGYVGGPSYGVRGEYSATGGYGGLGNALYSCYGYGGSSYSVRGYRDDNHYGYLGSASYGVYSKGNCHVSGTLSKSAGSFRIDHPLDPANKYLQHSFVESPDMKNVYDGVVLLDGKGEAVVQLPDYFAALNKDFRYQLTCIGGFAQVYIAEEISGNQFKIAGGEPGMKVSWQITGIRHDAYAEANRIQVEVNKEGKELGKYEHPELYGLSVEMRTDYDELQQEKAMHRQVLQEREREQEEQQRFLQEKEAMQNPD